ncbi:MAG: DNA-3-methyladenine glycosylase [Chloroflexota bacterium]|nr:DNA-3-methyladenine glycosylase [Chloroflexota bacterium]
MRLGPRLRRSFYARPTLEVARDLLGKTLVYDGPAGLRAARLVEVEGYLGSVDPASHAFRGPTTRTAPMFGPPGRAYVYFVYGMYFCMNVVAERAGTAGAALLRGAEPVLGLDDDPRSLAGPGKLCRALGITTAQTNWDLVTSRLCIHAAPPVSDDDVLATPRIGLRPGTTEHEAWRFVVRGSAGVSRG